MSSAHTESYRCKASAYAHVSAQRGHRFIMAFGGVGLFALTTASCGVIGVVTNRKLVLQTYAYLAIALLLVEVCEITIPTPQTLIPHDLRCRPETAAASPERGAPSQVAALVATFAESRGQKRLPHDKTGEAARIRRFLRICGWTGCIILALQARAYR